MEKTSSREEGLWVFSLTFPFLGGRTPHLESKHEKVQQMISLKAIARADGFSCGTCSRNLPIPAACTALL